MSKFRKKPVIIEANRWFQHADHPDDNCEIFNAGNGLFTGEGQIVRYYRTPDCDGGNHCRYCGNIMHLHGWIDTLEGGHVVCPGDWIITGIKGEYYPCKPDIFEATYEPI